MEEKFFELEIITPDRQFYEGKAWFVEMNTSEGNIGVYKNHIPLTCILAPGIVKILQDKITVMAEVAEWPDEIDANRAEEARIRAERRIKEGGEGVNIDRAEAALRRSLARIEALK